MNINTILNYAPLELRDEDIQSYPFEDLNNLLGHILADASYDCVHLICIDDNIFITHEIHQACKFIKSYSNYLLDVPIFWQEYYSYEEAYKVALSMHETSPFCYEQ